MFPASIANRSSARRPSASRRTARPCSTERVHASLSRRSLTMYTKLHADAAQSGTRLPSSAQPSAPTCGAPSSTGRAVVNFEFHRLTNRERLDLLSDHAIRPACGEERRWPRRGGSRLSMWPTRFYHACRQCHTCELRRTRTHAVCASTGRKGIRLEGYSIFQASDGSSRERIRSGR